MMTKSAIAIESSIPPAIVSYNTSYTGSITLPNMEMTYYKKIYRNTMNEWVFESLESATISTIQDEEVIRDAIEKYGKRE
jgi:hypothetical protein